MNHKAAINIIAAELGMAREDRQAVSLSLVGVASLADMSALQLAKVRSHFDHLQRVAGGATKATATQTPGRTNLATKITRPAAGRPAFAPERAPMVRRIRAQLISLGRLPDSYADKIVQRLFGAAAPVHYEWCNGQQMHKLSGELAQQQTRQAAKENIRA